MLQRNLILRNTVEIRCIQTPDVFPLTSIVTKLCKIECCVNTMLQIIENMMGSQGSEAKLSMLGRTTTSGQHPLVYVRVQNFLK